MWTEAEEECGLATVAEVVQEAEAAAQIGAEVEAGEEAGRTLLAEAEL